MLEDKLRETDWEVTQETIEEQVARESYLQWLQDQELRRRSHVGLNKGEQQNALRRAVFFNRLGEIRDRSYENQRHRASGLNLLVAAIILWNTTYLQRAIDHLRDQGQHPG